MIKPDVTHLALLKIQKKHSQQCLPVTQKKVQTYLQVVSCRKYCVCTKLRPPTKGSVRLLFTSCHNVTSFFSLIEGKFFSGENDLKSHVDWRQLCISRGALILCCRDVCLLLSIAEINCTRLAVLGAQFHVGTVFFLPAERRT